MDNVPSKSVREKLSQWDSRLAILEDYQKDGVMEISTLTNQRPFPDGLPASHGTRTVATPTSSNAHIPQIANTEELLSWFDDMDGSIESNQDKIYRDYCNHLTNYCSRCDSMLNQLSKALAALQDMSEKHKLVSHKTQSLHEACEQLVKEQNSLSTYAEGINNRLAYFTELDSLGQKLASPSTSLSPDAFSMLLSRLDKCIKFIEEHSEYKESSVYLARYKQQLSRALATVKQQVTSTLKTTTQSLLLQNQQQEHGGSPENVYSQYYGKFRTCAPKVIGLMKEIESRVEISTEYSTLLHDCLQCYISQRTQLLGPSVTATLQHYIIQYPTDCLSLVRSCCSFITRVCLDEYQLYEHFFTKQGQELNLLISNFSNQMYDSLRPAVIHVNHLETLTDICSILKVEVLEEVILPKGDQLTVLGGVINNLLRDTQQRLVYRTERYIVSDIHGFKPSPGDLAYPDKLVVAAQVQSQLIETYSDNESVFDHSGTDSEPTTPSVSSGYSLAVGRKGRGSRRHDLNELHAMWYPTVRRSLMCFSKLYRCLEKPVFEGLAQEVLSNCVISLKTAADLIKIKKSQQDASLFLIKHLLILREQIAAFNVNFSIKEVYLDFSKTKAAAYNLLKKRSRMFSLGSNNAFLEFLFDGFPELIETQLDSKKEVDKYLKEACELFITIASDALTAHIKSVLAKFEIVLELSRKEGHDPSTLISKQPYLSAKNIRAAVTDTNKVLKDQIPQLKRSLTLYLSNEETEHILFRPIKANILNVYQSLGDTVNQHYSLEDRQIISCLTQPELMLLLSVPSAPLFVENQIKQ